MSAPAADSGEDREFGQWAKNSLALAEAESEHSMWSNSPFEWISSLSAGSKSKIIKQLLDRWLIAHHIPFENSPELPGGRWIDGHLVQIKTSMLWKSGIYRFQQIKSNDCNYFWLVGLSPDQVNLWVVPRAELECNLTRAQHKLDGVVESYMLEISPERVPEWLEPFGGSLDQCLIKLR